MNEPNPLELIFFLVQALEYIFENKIINFETEIEMQDFNPVITKQEINEDDWVIIKRVKKIS